MLESVQTLSLPVVLICSVYASWEDVRRLVYPDGVDRALLATGLISTISFLVARGSDTAVLVEAGLGLIICPGALFILSKLGAVGEGDVRYSLALSLCFPTHPWGIIQPIEHLTGLTLIASSKTPFPAILLTNSLWLTGLVLMTRRLAAAERPSSPRLLYTVAVVLLAIAFSRRLLLLLPLPLVARPTAKSRRIPLIPFLFGGLLISLTLGDLSLRVLR